MQRYIETERLVLKPMTMEDAQAVYEIGSDPEVNRYMRYTRHKSLADAEAFLRSIGPEELEFGFYLKETGKLIGTGGIYGDENGSQELGYQLRRDAWGMGYATEAARALLRWANETLGLRDFVCCHAVKNEASGNVMRKCGFQFVRYGAYDRFDHSETFEAACYALHL